MYDYLIVGAGFFGSICACELKKIGKKVLVIDNRNHIGGNCYTENRDDINLHMYGPHIFHTSNQFVWDWINQYCSFNDFTYRPVANFKGEVFSIPFNMWTFSKLWNIFLPEDAKKIISEQGSYINDPENLEEQAIKLVGKDVYNILIKGYTEKQWKKDCRELPKEIIKRLPVRFNYDNNYFNDKYQGIPIGGYTQIFEKLLKDIDVSLNTDFFDTKLPPFNRVIYTGPIDKLFDYKFGPLEYKTVNLNHKKVDSDNYQGVAVMNFTDIETQYTRIIEHKHFESIQSDLTWLSYEYPVEYDSRINEPFYPVNDQYNNSIYRKYKELLTNDHNILVGGRLGEYKYYDMDKVIISAFKFIEGLNE